MSERRLFLDTVFVQALLNRRDRYHNWALSVLPIVQDAVEVWTTEAVLVEIGNALSAYNRKAAASFIQQCYVTSNIRVISVDTELLQEAVELYDNRSDKMWGLTDCISFLVMHRLGVTTAVTADHHFQQAGFEVLMRDER